MSAFIHPTSALGPTQDVIRAKGSASDAHFERLRSRMVGRTRIMTKCHLARCKRARVWTTLLGLPFVLALFVLAAVDAASAQGSFEQRYTRVQALLKAGNAKAALPESLSLERDYRARFGTGDPTYGVVLKAVAAAYQANNQSEQAEQAFRAALKVLELTRGPDHKLVGSALSDLADLLVSRSKYAEAVALFERAEPIIKRDAGPTSLDFAYLLNSKANALKGLGRVAEAYAARKEVLSAHQGTEATAEQIVATMLADPSVVAHVLRVAGQANVKEFEMTIHPMQRGTVGVLPFGCLGRQRPLCPSF